MKQRQPQEHLVSSRLKERLSNRADSEHEQALVRIVIVGIVLAYLFSPWYGDGTTLHLKLITQGVIGTYFLVSAGIFAAILISPGISPVRRSIGMFGDMSAISSLFALGGESSVPLVGLYLWVTMGNGFRYGLPYLLGSTLLSIAGFSGASLVNPYLQDHLPLVGGILLVLAILPLYMATLLRKLHRAIDQANEASQAKSRFLANMSHELRTPLNGVIGMASILRDMKLGHQQKDMVDTIHVSARMLLDLINDILDISKIESGKLTLKEEDLDIHHTVNNTVMLLQKQAQDKGLQMITHFDATAPFAVRGDPLLLKQVLTNLIANAIKFTERGRVDVAVHRVHSNESDLCLRFEVRDTGVGIPEAVQSQIFDSFVQGDDTSRRRHGGTGLGTAIAKQLVELMGGHIGLISREGKGSTFWFELPFKPQQQAPAEDRSSPGVSRVLIYASEAVAEQLHEYLKAWSVDFEMVTSLAQTLSRLMSDAPDEAKFDLLLVERGALTMEPEDFIRSIHQEPNLRALSPVLICDKASPAMEREYIQAGYNALLVLPLDRRLLFNALHAAGGRGSAHANVVSLAQHYRERGPNQSLHILVADDNSINQKVVQHILQRAGHQVDVADDGEMALDALGSDNGAYDLMILDMHMPGRNGLEVFKASRFLQESAHIPTIILTANATPQAAQDCRDTGVDAYLTKPVDPVILLETVARLASEQLTQLASEQRHGGKTSKSAGHPGGILNPFVLDQLLDLGSVGEFVGDLVSGYRRDGLAALELIDQAISQNDYAAYRDSLHALKGSSAEIGGSQMVRDCATLEAVKPFALVLPETMNKLNALRNLFDATCNGLVEHLEQRLQQRDPSR